jgi:hypothetical protein
MVAAASPEAYEAALVGWRRSCVALLRDVVRSVKGVEETIKWGNVVYLAGGPAFMIRAEDERVLFGFWRGSRLRTIEPRLKPGGKYEMATLEIRQGDGLDPTAIRKLARAAVALNRQEGDPTAAAPPRKTSVAVKATARQGRVRISGAAKR